MIGALAISFLPVFLPLWTEPATQTQPEPVASLLTRFRAQLNLDLDRTPRYSCLATLDRSILQGAKNKPLAHDRMRIRIAVLDSGEAYAWPDSPKFEIGALKLLARGAAGSSSGLSGWVRIAAGLPESSFKDAGECALNGTRGTRYEVQVPWATSSYSATLGARQLVLPYSARFCVNASTAELMSLEVHAEQLKPPLAEISETVVYAHSSIGMSEWLAPQSRELSILDTAGNLQRISTGLTDCKLYEDATPPESTKEATPSPARSLPANLTLDMKLDTPISFEQSAVGDAVTARLQHAVRTAGFQLPKGTLLNGRIGRLEEQFTPEQHYVVGLEFTTIRLDVAEVRFHARLSGPALRYDRRPESVTGFGDPLLMPPIWDAKGLEIDNTDPTSRLGVFSVRASKLNIAPGLHMIWQTLPLN